MLAGWDNYFMLMGGASASLIGLLFVVITLTAGFERANAERGQALYMTPTMVNFAVVFAITAVAQMPRLPRAAFAVLAAAALALGLLNAVRSSVGISKPRPGAPPPHWSDLWMYGIGPGLLHVLGFALCLFILVGTAWAAPSLAGLLLVVLMVGVRNAWDLITTIAPLRGAAPRS
ncbi:MAG TPA: hypothetical protein VMU37_04755 [Caulobacteraceae bacterium]|nr:hypothetical protein [Caulobacteraceae bacterium]